MPGTRSLRWLLPASLALNAFLGALVVTQWLSPPPPPRPDRMIEDMAQILPPADATILRQSFAAHAPDLGRHPPGRDVMFQRISQALKSDPFDPKALENVFREGRQGRDALDDSIEDALVDAATRMSSAGRHKLAEWHPRPPRG